jgi:hypothetical protein
MISGTAAPASHHPSLRFRRRLISGSNGNRVITLYLVKTARPANTPAPMYDQQPFSVFKARSQNTSDQIQKANL